MLYIPTEENDMDTFAAIIAQARTRSGMTAAAFDYSLASGDGKALAGTQDAIYTVANRGTQGSVDERQRRATDLRTEVTPQIDAMIEAAKNKTYTGWSAHSAGPIRYAR